MHDMQATPEWTPWTLLDGLGPLLRVIAGQNYDGVCDTLVHLERLKTKVILSPDSINSG
jgi:hypothetical protein